MTRDPRPSIRIVLVDDHAVVRSGLRLLVEAREGWTVVGEAGTAEEAVAVTTREQPDLVLLDLDLGGASGLECLPRLRAAAPDTRVLILTGVRETELHQQAVRLGAAGVLIKDRAADSLLKAIERVHAGETWLDRAMTASLLAELAGAGRAKAADPHLEKIARLTGREREVIACVAEGLRNEEIGRRLHISEATVRHHLTSIFEKLDVRDRLGLTIFAYRYDLAAPSR